MRIVFFGTSSFAAKILSHLFAHSCSIVAVVTRPDRPKGRHLQPSFSPVKQTLLLHQPALPLLQPEKVSTPENASLLKSYRPDLFLVVAYGEIIKRELLDIPPLGCVNIHASLLPQYRGAAPIQRCLMAGEKKTGITLISMTPQMDAGDILVQAEIPISPDMNFGALEAALCDLSCALIIDFLKDLQRGTVSHTPQDAAQATFAPKVLAQDERIAWDRPASAVHNLVRALSPSPGAWCTILLGKEEKRLKIKQTRVVHSAHQAPPGTVLSCGKEGWVIACREDALELLEVQLEGKKSLPVSDFLKGLHHTISFF